MHSQTDEQWMADVMKELEQNKASTGGGIRFADTPKKAGVKFVFRILPAVPECGGRFAKLVYKHFQVTDTVEDCMRTWRRECPICNVVQKYASFADWIKKYTSSGKAQFNVQIVNNPEFDPNQAYVLGLSDFFLSWLIKVIQDPVLGNQNLLDPIAGQDICIWRKKDSGAFEKIISSKVRAIAETPERINQILATRYNLDQIYKSDATDEAVRNAINTAKDLERRIQLRIGQGPSSPAQQQQQPPLLDAHGGSTANPEFDRLKASSGKACFGKFDRTNKECVFCSFDVDCIRMSGAASGGSFTNAAQPAVDGDIPF